MSQQQSSAVVQDVPAGPVVLPALDERKRQEWPEVNQGQEPLSRDQGGVVRQAHGPAAGGEVLGRVGVVGHQGREAQLGKDSRRATAEATRPSFSSQSATFISVATEAGS